MPRVHLVAPDNGFGLSRDLSLLSRALQAAGCEVEITRLDAQAERRRWRLGGSGLRAGLARRLRRSLPRRARYDLNVMLEHVWPEQARLGRVNVLMPNPEWFDGKDRRQLGEVDAVWAKTTHAAELFAALGCRVRRVGFDSEAPYLEQVPRQRRFFHLAGGSRSKGTEALLALWRRHPDWPTLTVWQHPACAPDDASAANIDHQRRYLDAGDPAQLAAFDALRNAHRFHLCPSSTEGWGHYLVEALGLGAVTLTLDAAPMNELVRPERGLLVACRPSGSMGLATTHAADPEAMEAAIERMLELPDRDCARLGQQARAWCLHNREDFRQRLRDAVQASLDAPR